MTRALLSFILVAAICALFPGAADAQVVARFEVSNVVFSPDGDAVEDTSNVNFTLSAAAISVSVVVLESDSITPVDTLLAAQALPSGRTDLGWDGMRWDDSPAADGAYVVVLSVTAGSDTTATRGIFIDTGLPSIVVDSVSPSPYAPGATGQPSELNIAFTVAAASPSYVGIPFDEIQYEFRNPNDNVIAPDTIRFEPEWAGADGSYRLVWNASNQLGLPDGEYLVTMTIVDQAGHASSSDHTFMIDADEPTVSVKSPPGGSYMTSPDSIRGWAWDASGIAQVDVQYREDGPFLPAVMTPALDDTVLFAAQLADSLVEEGAYDIIVRALDDFGRENTVLRKITVDRTAPLPPVLDPFEGAWHTNTFRVTGDLPGAPTVPSLVRFYRNGGLVDSAFVAPKARINRDVSLVAGSNVLTATFVDAAKNESAPSNALQVTFDDNSGLFIDSPLRPGGRVNVNLSSTGVHATLRVYDLTGDLVILIDDYTETRNYSFPWTAYNGRGKVMKKGPLVAVVTVDLANGEKQTFREAFLHDPEEPQ